MSDEPEEYEAHCAVCGDGLVRDLAGLWTHASISDTEHVPVPDDDVSHSDG